ncbi:condensation domain-containing protein [Streptomyces erythrochromogenes]|uniref:condensation domain-containing protein n=1 Tax=Streptomyces erythrochromogenes TaxID=285574 RepID=UPI0036904F98
MAFDHSVTDLHSLALAAVEIQQLYLARCGREAPVSPPAGSFLDFCIEERHVSPARVLGSVTRWRGFTEADQGRLPRFSLHLGIDEEEDVPLTAEEIELCDATAADIFEARCRTAGGSLFAGLLAALGMISRISSDQGVLRLLAPYQTRTPATRSALGWFVNAVPLELRMDDESNFDALVPRARAAIRRAFEYLDVPFGLVERETEMQPFTGSGGWISYMDYRPYNVDHHPATLGAQILTNPRRGRELDIWISRTGDGVSVHARYPDNAVAKRNVRAYLRELEEVIDHLVIRDEGHRPTRPTSEVG